MSEPCTMPADIDQRIRERLKYLREQEVMAIDELDPLRVGSMEREAKWALIRELTSRRSELEMLFPEFSNEPSVQEGDATKEPPAL